MAQDLSDFTPDVVASPPATSLPTGPLPVSSSLLPKTGLQVLRDRMNAEYNHVPQQAPTGAPGAFVQGASSIVGNIGRLLGGTTNQVSPQLQQEHPIAYAAGQTVPKLAAQGALTLATGGTSIPAQAAIAGVVGGGSEAISNPNATVGSVAKQGALDSALSLGGQMAGLGLTNAINYFGKSAIARNLWTLVNSGTPEAKVILEKVFNGSPAMNMAGQEGSGVKDVFDLGKQAAIGLQDTPDATAQGIKTLLPGSTGLALTGLAGSVADAGRNYVGHALGGGVAGALGTGIYDLYSGKDINPLYGALGGSLGVAGFRAGSSLFAASPTAQMVGQTAIKAMPYAAVTTPSLPSATVSNNSKPDLTDFTPD